MANIGIFLDNKKSKSLSEEGIWNLIEKRDKEIINKIYYNLTDLLQKVWQYCEMIISFL